MPELRIALTVGPQTPFSVGAGGSAGALADKVCVRDGYGRLIVPGSQVKGKLRHACGAILRSLERRVCRGPRADTMCGHDVEPCALCRLFGSPFHPSPLTFADLVYHDPIGGLEYNEERRRLDAQGPLRPGIGVDRRRGTVAENLLFLTETSPAVGAAAAAPGGDPGDTSGAFTNERAITGRVPDVAHARLLLAGLAALTAWGGSKSRGLGWAWVRATVQVVDVTEFVLDTLTGERPDERTWEELNAL